MNCYTKTMLKDNLHELPYKDIAKKNLHKRSFKDTVKKKNVHELLCKTL